MATFAQGSEFNMDKDDFSALEIRDSGQPSGFHYFFDTKRNTLITDFILEDRQRVSTFCQITLIKKDDGSRHGFASGRRTRPSSANSRPTAP